MQHMMRMPMPMPVPVPVPMPAPQPVPIPMCPTLFRLWQDISPRRGGGGLEGKSKPTSPPGGVMDQRGEERWFALVPVDLVLALVCIGSTGSCIALHWILHWFALVTGHLPPPLGVTQPLVPDPMGRTPPPLSLTAATEQQQPTSLSLLGNDFGDPSRKGAGCAVTGPGHLRWDQRALWACIGSCMGSCIGFTGSTGLHGFT